MKPNFPASVNQLAPSGPAEIPKGNALDLGTEYSVMPLDVPLTAAARSRRPILFAPVAHSVNQIAPSGPVVTYNGLALLVTVAYSVICGSKAVALIGMRPTLLVPVSVN